MKAEKHTFDVGMRALAVFLVLLFSLTYWLHPDKPSPDGGWLSWADQGEIDRIARSLADFKVPERPFFPIGYPLLGALFIKFFYPYHFFIPNLALYVVTVCLWYAVARKILEQSYSFIFLLLLLFGTQITFYFSIPWTHFLTFGLASVVFYLFFAEGELSPRKILLLSIASGLLMFVRVPEFLSLLPVVGFVFWRGVKGSDKRKRASYSLYFAAPFIILLALFFYTNSIFYSSPFTIGYHVPVPGTMHTQEDVLHMYSLTSFFSKSYAFIVNPEPLFRTNLPCGFIDLPVLGYSPFFLFAVFGLYRFVKANRRLGVLGFSCILLTMLISLFGYFGNDTLSPLSLKYFALRKLVIWLPLWTILSVLGMASLLEYRKNPPFERKAAKMLSVLVVSIVLIPPLLAYLGLSRVPYNFNASTTSAEYNVGDEVTIKAVISDRNLRGVTGKVVHGTYALDSEPSSLQPIEFKDEGNGTYTSAFIPKKAGTYNIVLMSPSFGAGIPDKIVNPTVRITVRP